MVRVTKFNVYHYKAISDVLLHLLAKNNGEIALNQETLILGNQTCRSLAHIYKLFYTKGSGRIQSFILASNKVKMCLRCKIDEYFDGVDELVGRRKTPLIGKNTTFRRMLMTNE